MVQGTKIRSSKIRVVRVPEEKRETEAEKNIFEESVLPNVPNW